MNKAEFVEELNDRLRKSKDNVFYSLTDEDYGEYLGAERVLEEIIELAAKLDE